MSSQDKKAKGTKKKAADGPSIKRLKQLHKEKVGKACSTTWELSFESKKGGGGEIKKKNVQVGRGEFQYCYGSKACSTVLALNLFLSVLTFSPALKNQKICSRGTKEAGIHFKRQH